MEDTLKRIIKTFFININSKRDKATLCVLLCLFVIIGTSARPGTVVHAASSSLSGFSALIGSDEQLAGKIADELGEVDLEAEKEKEIAEADPLENFTEEDLKYLSCVIYCETEPLGYTARVALGNIVLNRMYDQKSWGHVSTIKEVIYDKNGGYEQFDCAWGKNGKSSKMSKALKIYDSVLAGTTSKYEKWQIKGMTECIQVAKDVMCGVKVVPDDFVFCRGEKYFAIDIATCEKYHRYYRILEKHIYYSFLTDY